MISSIMDYDHALDEISRYTKGPKGKDSAGVLQFVCDYRRKIDERYSWVGFYVVSGDNLILKNFSGDETEHKKIKIGDGLCSLAVLRNEIVNEKDVKSNNTYLACFPSTNSEIVVPVRMHGEPIGEIDVDSDTKNAFGMKDESFLSKIADKLSEHVKNVASNS